MKKISTILIFIAWTTVSFGQGEMKGTWILESYAVDSPNPIQMKDMLRKEQITFDSDGRYIKTYREEELPDGARIQMTYSTLDKKFTKKYFNKDGYEIKVIRVRKKTENGTYKKTDSNELLFSTAKKRYAKYFKVNNQHLDIADTLHNRVIWNRYKKRS